MGEGGRHVLTCDEASLRKDPRSSTRDLDCLRAQVDFGGHLVRRGMHVEVSSGEVTRAERCKYFWDSP